MGDPGSSVKLFEILRGRYDEQLDVIPDINECEGTVPQAVIDKYWIDFAVLVEQKNSVEMYFNKLKRFFKII